MGKLANEEMRKWKSQLGGWLLRVRGGEMLFIEFKEFWERGFSFYLVYKVFHFLGKDTYCPMVAVYDSEDKIYIVGLPSSSSIALYTESYSDNNIFELLVGVYYLSYTKGFF